MNNIYIYIWPACILAIYHASQGLSCSIWVASLSCAQWSVKEGKMVTYKKFREESLLAFWICQSYHFHRYFSKSESSCVLKLPIKFPKLGMNLSILLELHSSRACLYFCATAVIFHYLFSKWSQGILCNRAVVFHATFVMSIVDASVIVFDVLVRVKM